MKNTLRSFNGFKASRANVTGNYFTFVYVRNLLNVSLERSSRSSFRVAHVVARGLAFSADCAYSRHIKHLRIGIISIRVFSKKAEK